MNNMTHALYVSEISTLRGSEKIVGQIRGSEIKGKFVLHCTRLQMLQLTLQMITDVALVNNHCTNVS